MSLLLLLAGSSSGAPAVEPVPRLDSAAIELALNGSYYDAVLTSSPAGFWLLGEQLSATGARDSSGFARHGTYTGGITHGQAGLLPHGGTVSLLNGTTGYMSAGDVAVFEFASAFSVEAWFKVASISAVAGLVGKQLTANDAGWGVTMTATGAIRFFAETAASASVFDITTTGTYIDGLWHHLVCTWDGTTASNEVKIYIDGAEVKTGTAVSGTIAANAARLLVGARDNAGAAVSFLPGTLTGVAVYASELSSSAVSTHYATAQWTDIYSDTIGVLPGLSMEYGTRGTGPLDRLANAGLLTCSLHNAEKPATGKLAGRYSPLHTNCLAGFTYNIPIRVRLTWDGTTYTKFWGRLAVINPDPGVSRSRLTHCLAQDYAYLLSDTDVRSITAQLGQTDNDLIRTVFDAMPPDAQPMALALDTSVDSFTYAFDDLEGGRKATTALKKVLVSAWSRGGVLGDGTFWTQNRNATTNQIIDFTLDDDMTELEVPSDRSDVFDHVRVVTHPKTIDAAATSVLFSHPTANTAGQAPFVAANGGTLEIWSEHGYSNPANKLQTVGGTAMVTPVSATDFIAWSAADGTGTNLTASVTVTASYFASTVKLVLTNNHATLGAYFTTLQVRGKGIYDNGPVTLEAVGTPGTRPITVDLPYQGDGAKGQAIADIVLNERQAITDPVHSVTINPQRSNALMLMAVSGEPGDLVSVSETQTGLMEAQAAIRSLRLELSSGLNLQATMGLTPIVVGYEWMLDDPNFSQLGSTTVLSA